jgi:hypothetical protein
MIRPQADVSYGPSDLPKDRLVRKRPAFTGGRRFCGRDRACLTHDAANNGGNPAGWLGPHQGSGNALTAA